ncbi:MAG TPA: SIMPL domain-containing protein [Longimicrobiales bacterium]|nr:SIMPL domain-containing protein [Longimicrobiales bacterium]
MRQLVLAALVAATLPGRAAAQAVFLPAVTDSPRVSVQGIGEVVVPAARATALFVLRSEGEDVAAVAATAAALKDAAVVALQGVGLDASAYSLVSFGAGPAAGTARTRAPGQPIPRTLQESKAALRVVVDPVDRLDQIVAAVLGAGAESLMSVTFEPGDRPDARREAARRAMAQAKADAEALAEAAGMRLGQVIQVSSTPDYVRQAFSGAMIRTSVSQGVAVVPSDVTVRVTLQAVWALVPR